MHGLSGFAYVHSFLRIGHFLVTEVAQGDETIDAIIQANFDPNSLARALPSIKMIPNLTKNKINNPVTMPSREIQHKVSTRFQHFLTSLSSGNSFF